MALSVAGLLLFGTPLDHWGPGFGLDALPSEAPGEGARETPSGKPLGKPLHLGAGIAATQAQFGEGGAGGALLCPLGMLLDDAQGRTPDRLCALRLPRCALCQESLRELVVDAASLQLLQQRAIATLSRAVTRIEKRLPEPLVINQADLHEARNCGAHMFFRIASGNQALFKALAGARRTAERACSRLQYIGGLCRCSAGFLRFRVAATSHDAPLLRFGSDGGGNLKRR